jgi:alkylated DNA repair protein (DNA oxidative demethylase)
MSDLFDDAPLPGLTYQDGILAADEERALVARIAALPFAPFQFQGWEGKRRTVSYGWSYDFNDGQLREAPPLPGFLRPLRERAAALAEVGPESFEHALVIEYAVGAGIGWHRDRPQFDVVCGVSLVAPCTMRFRRRVGTRFERVGVPLAPRSAYVLRGPARHEWEHSIVPMEELRYSVTFRSLVASRG